MEEKNFPLLHTINGPEDLKKIPREDLIRVCKELRDFIIEELSCNPGHFGASLGVVELTVALHYVFQTPYDNLIWDVGHQAYGHKIITGRKHLFHTNRKFKGISGFPKIAESPFDTFGTGHSSTSVSAALGMAVAADRMQEDNRHTVAIIGDGALTGGMAFEALNNAGTEKSDLLVILNDNNMAIDPIRGAMKEYLLDITTSKSYNRFKDDTWKALGKISKIGPDARSMVQTLENAVKHMILKQSNLFESLNFRYFGPVDGHDVIHLTKILEDLKHIRGPKLLHIITKKGKGFKQAEINQTTFHAPGLFDKKTGELIKEKTEGFPLRYQDIFGHTLLELAEQNEKIIGITPAMPSGSSLNIMMEKMPERTFDVGIAEQHAVTFSAGMAAKGLIPFCNIYSSFIQRGYDQIIHDVALQNLSVIFCLDRGGLVGADGPTHHGAYDLAFLRLVPGIIISAPMDEIELRNLMYTAQLKPRGPFSIRYPRGKGIHLHWKKPFAELPIGKGRQLVSGEKVAILSLGTAGNLVSSALKTLAKDGIHPSHYDLRFLKPIDQDLLHEAFRHQETIITVEDGTVIGGLGSAVIEFKEENQYRHPIIRMGIPDQFIEQGTPRQLYKVCGFDSDAIAEQVRKAFQQQN